MNLEECWQKCLVETPVEPSHGVDPERLATRYDVESLEEIDELTRRAKLELGLNTEYGELTLDELDKAAERMDVDVREVATDGGQCVDGTVRSRLAELKFADEHIEPILAGRKTATIRYEIDSHDALHVGRTFHLVDGDGERFASAIVHDRGYTTAEWIVENGVEGHEPYRDLDSFYKQMREYYPQAELGPETCFEIVYWKWGELWE